MRITVFNAHGNGNTDPTGFADWIAGMLRPDADLTGPNRFRVGMGSEAHNKAGKSLGLEEAGDLYQSGKGQGPREVVNIFRGFPSTGGRLVPLTPLVEERFAHDRWLKITRGAPHDVPTSFLSFHANPAKGGGRPVWVSKGLPALGEAIDEERALGHTPIVGGDGNEKPGGPLEKLLKAKGLTYVSTDVMWLAWDEDAWTRARKIVQPQAPGSEGHGVLVVDLMPFVPAKPVHPPLPAPGGAARIIALAKTQVGVREGKTSGRNNNNTRYPDEVPGLEWADGQPWCASFMSWLALKTDQAGLYPRTASCDVGGNWFKERSRWSEYPAIGAQAFYGSPADLNHTGLVIAYDADTITTIEGNTNDTGSREGDGVYLKVRQRRSTNVVGYGYPAFGEGIVSADPAWQKKATTPSSPGTPSAPSDRKTGDPWPIAGIDLSHHNDGRIDWAKAKAAGVRFVFHKATEHLAFRDEQYASRRAEVKAAGLPFGAYHFARPSKSSGVAQARFFLAVAKPAKGDLRPVLDLEDTGGLSLAKLTDWAADFAAEVLRQTGQPPTIYTPFELTRNLDGFLWVARYSPVNADPRVPKAWERWTIHQFSNGETGVPVRVPGIGFPVDINTLRPGFDLKRMTL